MPDTRTDAILLRLEGKIDKLQDDVVPRSEHLLRDREVNNRFDRMELKLDETIRQLMDDYHKVFNRVLMIEERTGDVPDRVKVLETRQSERDGESRLRQYAIPLALTIGGFLLNMFLAHAGII